MTAILYVDIKTLSQIRRKKHKTPDEEWRAEWAKKIDDLLYKTLTNEIGKEVVQ